MTAFWLFETASMTDYEAEICADKTITRQKMTIRTGRNWNYPQDDVQTLASSDATSNEYSLVIPVIGESSSFSSFPGFVEGETYMIYVEWFAADDTQCGVDFMEWLNVPMTLASAPLGVQACEDSDYSTEPCLNAESIDNSIHVHWQAPVSIGYCVHPCLLPSPQNQIDYYTIEVSSTEDFSSVKSTHTCSSGQDDNLKASDASDAYIAGTDACKFDARIAVIPRLNAETTYFVRIAAGTIIGNGEFCVAIETPTVQGTVSFLFDASSQAAPQDGDAVDEPYAPGLCQKCDEDEYLDQTQLYCIACPAESKTHNTASQQVSVENCLCNAGYHQPAANAANTDCLACLKGTYKSADLDDSACLLCSFFSAFMTTESKASTAYTDCLCNAGYYHEYTVAPEEDDCLQCAAGTYKTGNGNEVDLCKECPTDVYCPSGSTAVTQCPPNSQAGVGSTQLSDCHCDVGFYTEDTLTDDVLTSRVCQPCAAGTYQDATNEPDCKNCPAGKYNELLQQDADTACLSCDATNPTYADSAAGSDQFSDCFCVAGHFHATDLSTAGEVCQQCNPGTYRTSDMVFDGSAYGTGTYLCEACGPDKYNVDQASTSETACTDCPADTRTPDGATGQVTAAACQCKLGHQVETPSTDENTPPSCTVCVEGKYADELNTLTCLDCQAGKASSATQAENIATCLACEPGTISASDGAVSCTDCDNDQYQVGTGESICTDCPALTGHRSTGVSNILECLCNAGFTYNADPTPSDSGCIACAAGTYKDLDRSNDDCTECTSVSANSHSAEQSDHLNDCFCNAGFYANPVANGLVNDASHLGLNPSGSGNNACVQCPEERYCGPEVNADSSSRTLGFEFCRANSYSPAGSSVFSHCKCKAGFYFNGDASLYNDRGVACDLCRTDLDDQGFYCPANDDEARPCGANTASHSFHDGADGISKLAAYEFQDCVCLEGFWRNCIKDTSVGAGLQDGIEHILKVDGDIFDPPETTTCTRDQTYFESDCSACPSHTACALEEQMQHCPTHATSPPGSDQPSDCKCTAGFKEVAQPA